MMRVRGARMFVIGTVAAILLGACGNKTATTLTGTNPPTVPSTSTSPASQPMTISARTNAKLGTVLVDERGFTLYLNTQEKGAQIRCTGQCASNWPAVTLPSGTMAATAGAGIKASLLGVVKRSDGSEQVTYNGWPLHTFAGDSAPGDTNGESISGIWFAVTTSGAAADVKPSPAAATKSTPRTPPASAKPRTSTPKPSPTPTKAPSPTPSATSTCTPPYCY